jgi:phage-related protein
LDNTILNLCSPGVLEFINSHGGKVLIQWVGPAFSSRVTIVATNHDATRTNETPDNFLLAAWIYPL